MQTKVDARMELKSSFCVLFYILYILEIVYFVYFVYFVDFVDFVEFEMLDSVYSAGKAIIQLTIQ